MIAGGAHSQGGLRFLQFQISFAQKLNTSKSRTYRTKRGKTGGGAWAHWQIGAAYATYFDDELHMQFNASEATDRGKKVQKPRTGGYTDTINKKAQSCELG